MSLNETFDKVSRSTHNYLYLEKIGPFQENAPAAWQEILSFLPSFPENFQIVGVFSQYKAEQEIYRAGFSLSEPPTEVPDGLQFELVPSGEFIRFELVGSWSQLADATARVFAIINEQRIAVTNDFFVENYVGDPSTTPEDELVTEILVPISA